MNYFIFRTFLILTLLTGVTAAQTTPGPPKAKIQTDSQETKNGPPPAERSLADLRAGETFYFPEGNFSISLPVAAMGLGPVQDTENGPARTYMGFFKEGMIILAYEDFTDPAFSLKTDKEYQDFFDAHKNEALKRSKAKLISEGPLKSGEFRGWFVAFQMPDGSTGFARDFYANRRRYSLSAFIKKDVPGAGESMAKALDSFRPGVKPELGAEMRKHIEKNTPPALPRRIVHNYNGNHKETLVYDDTGRLSGKYLYILDEKGNEIEKTDFKDPLQAGKDDTKWVYIYDALDEKGNWTTNPVKVVNPPRFI
jgi:hypothetical protein